MAKKSTAPTRAATKKAAAAAPEPARAGAAHVYMSTAPIPRRADASQNFENVIFNRRGQVGPGDDPASFARKMAGQGYHVFTHPTDLGRRLRCTSASFAPELLVQA